jgi:HAD superfamily hydrolase (TIGR01490 family)
MQAATKTKLDILAVSAAFEDKGQGLALFDVDGTLLPGDTLWDFFTQTHGNLGRWAPIWACRKPIVQWKLGKLSNSQAKERLLSEFYKGKSEKELREQGLRMLDRIWPRMYSQALNTIEAHRQAGATLALVSASPQIWMQEFGRRLNISTVLCTQLKFKNGVFTGEFLGQNCYGPEKARRIQEAFNLNSFSQIYAYGDSRGDREMLALATHPHFRPFKP